MKLFNIKRVKARNFLCFGEEGIDIDFEKKSNIILIKGRNEDIPDDNEEEKIASNGVGKSSISEVIVYGLTGSTIRKVPKAENLINNKLLKGSLKVEIWVDDLRIVRTRGKSATLTVYETIDGEEIDKTMGTTKDTQEWIYNKLNIKSIPAFVNLLVFTDNNAGSFLESNAEDRRNQAETNFNLGIYAKYHDATNKLLTGVKNDIKYLNTELMAAEKNLTKAQINVDRAKNQDVEWKKAKQDELQLMIVSYKNKQKEMEKSDTGQALILYEEAQNKIKILKPEINLDENLLNETKEILNGLFKEGELFQNKKNEISLATQDIKSNISISKNKLQEYESSISNLETKRCPHCKKLPIDGNDEEALRLKLKQGIELENDKINNYNVNLEQNNNELNDITEKLKDIKEKYSEKEKQYKHLNSQIDSKREEFNKLLKVDKPEISLNEKLLQSQLDELGKQILAKKDEADGNSPYVENIKNAEEEKNERIEELEVKKKELNTASHSVQLYEFWRKAFGDNGIRKFVIDGIIPVLNERIYYWLKFLIDNKLSLEFDNSLKEKIERNPSDGDPFVYSVMSGGERRRLNLAVAVAMSYVTASMSGTCPSIIFLDEVTTNIDPIGVLGVYNMIIELANERQVIVTTHDQTLQKMLENYDSIKLIKKDGISSIEN